MQQLRREGSWAPHVSFHRELATWRGLPTASTNTTMAWTSTRTISPRGISSSACSIAYRKPWDTSSAPRWARSTNSSARRPCPTTLGYWRRTIAFRMRVAGGGAGAEPALRPGEQLARAYVEHLGDDGERPAADPARVEQAALEVVPVVANLRCARGGEPQPFDERSHDAVAAEPAPRRAPRRAAPCPRARPASARPRHPRARAAGRSAGSPRSAPRARPHPRPSSRLRRHRPDGEDQRAHLDNVQHELAPPNLEHGRG